MEDVREKGQLSYSLKEGRKRYCMWISSQNRVPKSPEQVASRSRWFVKGFGVAKGKKNNQ